MEKSKRIIVFVGEIDQKSRKQLEEFKAQGFTIAILGEGKTEVDDTKPLEDQVTFW